MAVNNLAEARVGLQRLRALLLMPEIMPIAGQPADPKLAIELIHGSFAWQSRDTRAADSSATMLTNTERKQRKSMILEQRAAHRASMAAATRASQTAANTLLPLHTGASEKQAQSSLAMESLVPTVSSWALADLNLRIPCGSLVGICGSVGAGKSSLLSALLGQVCREMDRDERWESMTAV
jgi:ATP-binding cassette, subfamily C (CFTR/MRP), member 5